MRVGVLPSQDLPFQRARRAGEGTVGMKRDRFSASSLLGMTM
jgi:hypothetical protein